MVSIRLARGGAKKRPFYRVVVTDKRNARDGRFIEQIGFYNPIAPAGSEQLRLNAERMEYWLGVGAKPSPRVQQLMSEPAQAPEAATRPATAASAPAPQPAAEPAPVDAAAEAPAADAEATAESGDADAAGDDEATPAAG